MCIRDRERGIPYKLIFQNEIEVKPIEEKKVGSLLSSDSNEIQLDMKLTGASVDSVLLNTFEEGTGLAGKVEAAERHRRKKGLTLYDSLLAFSEPEQLAESNEWYCNQCKLHVRAFKHIEIYKAPLYLIIHLKRFRGGWGFLGHSKVEIELEFPLKGLDMTEFVTNHEEPDAFRRGESRERRGPLLYDLVAVTNHYGTMEGGHYTAFCLNSLKQCWYEFDDEKVTAISPKDVITAAAYILIYRRVDSQ
eukprot:TRINITY_DN14625_c0_g2_i1.p1 TRINITY_DN14625_c0_g2~~TRINITY_DN14625_c0_g2_i1.p1  ORF type:complete len:248 (+),score=54.99 TRINITY_DN14625_c0_g2_i1:63-806(+)